MLCLRPLGQSAVYTYPIIRDVIRKIRKERKQTITILCVYSHLERCQNDYHKADKGWEISFQEEGWGDSCAFGKVCFWLVNNFWFEIPPKHGWAWDFFQDRGEWANKSIK